MRNHILALFIIMLAACSCGTQKAATGARSPKVQTSFFGAYLGESRTFVERKIERDHALFSTKTRNELTMYNVSFAGCEWPYVYLDFVESNPHVYGRNAQQFSRIGFVFNSKDKQKASQRFDDIYQLLNEKYPLVSLNDPQYEKRFAYTDSLGNIVALVLMHSSEEPDTWLCMFMYSWGKARAVEMEKARKDI